MTKEESIIQFIEKVNPWWSNKDFHFDIIDRDFYLNLINNNKNKLIRILIGARRVGKTSILRSLINNYIKNKFKTKKIIYIPADLQEVKDFGIKKTIEIIEEYLKIDIFKNETLIFIDEIQEVNKWQEDLKVLYDNTKVRFFISGSSSLMLKKETAKLTGRFLMINILPLSFVEFLKFNKAKKKDEDILLQEYLNYGGYPEFVISKDPTYLQQAVESTLYRELLDYYGIRNPKLLNILITLLADKITTPVSANRIAKDLNIDDKTAKFYLEYLESIFLIYPVYRYGQSHKKSKSSIPKYYFNDTGILSILGIRQRIGHLVENAVFLELLRRESMVEKPKIFYDVIDSQEIDFRCNNNFYEVKEYKLNLDEEVLKYEGLKQDINIIIDNYDNKKNELPYFGNIKYTNLKSFLKGEI